MWNVDKATEQVLYTMFSRYSYLNMNQYTCILLIRLCSSNLVECVWLPQICLKASAYSDRKAL